MAKCKYVIGNHKGTEICGTIAQPGFRKKRASSKTCNIRSKDVKQAMSGAE